MNISVGLMENREAVDVELFGSFVDPDGRDYAPGRYRFTSPVSLAPVDFAASSFSLDDVTIGIGFHWERRERQVFKGGLRILLRQGLTVINDIPLEDYVASVISSEMSALCPLELLKAHAVISRGWLCYPKMNPAAVGSGNRLERTADEVIRWYGREAHRDFDVCADDHCQRYQGITKATAPTVAVAVAATAGQVLWYAGKACDARFSKCCGGITEEYRAAWEDQEVPYLIAFRDDETASRVTPNPESWILDEQSPAFCNTRDPKLLSQLLPGFDLETRDFYRWTVRYSPEDVRELVKARLDEDLGVITSLEPLQRGPSGRIVRLRLVGEKKSLTVGKELEIRRALSKTHLYSSAFVVQKDRSDFILKGAGWGHGVGLCQIGAAVMASQGKRYEKILSHYYPGTTLEPLEKA
jgi:stage II sporulation protein D